MVKLRRRADRSARNGPSQPGERPVTIARLAPLWVVALLLSSAKTSWADGKVVLEIVTAPKFSSLDTQKWYRLLTELKVSGLTIRSQRGSDRQKVTITGTKSRPVYRVTGLLNDRGELLLPGGRFTLRDRAKLANWLSTMRTRGPEGDKASDTPFGLSTTELDSVHRRLGGKVGFSTVGVDRTKVVEKLTAGMRLPVSQARGAAAALREAGPVQTELKGMAHGAAMAYVLRPAGLGLLPLSESAGVRLYLVASSSTPRVWPVGLSAEDQRRKLLPVLFDIINVEIDRGTPLSKALPILQQRLGVPFLLDHNRLAAKGIDIDKALIVVKPRRTSVSVVLRSVLAQARLKSELRTDEADQPFIWITAFGK